MMAKFRGELTRFALSPLVRMPTNLCRAETRSTSQAPQSVKPDLSPIGQVTTPTGTPRPTRRLADSREP